VLGLGLENADDRFDRAPTARRHRRTDEFVDLAEVADRFHVAAILAEEEGMVHREDPYEPLSVSRQLKRRRSPAPARLGQHADESNDVTPRRSGSERSIGMSAQQLARVAGHDVRFERQRAAQGCVKFRSYSRITDDECPRGPDVHDAVALELFRQNARAKRAMPADVHPSKKDDQRHVS
jgi:hypothetical protein